MTPPTPLTELADCVQALTSACRETDAEIFRSVGAPLPDKFLSYGVALAWDEKQRCFTMPVGDMQIRYEHPAYTASLDAAMTLARTPQEAYQAMQDATSAIAKRDDLHCSFYRGSFTDDLARQASAILIRAPCRIGVQSWVATV